MDLFSVNGRLLIRTLEYFEKINRLDGIDKKSCVMSVICKTNSARKKK